jgi:serine protease Do
MASIMARATLSAPLAQVNAPFGPRQPFDGIPPVFWENPLMFNFNAPPEGRAPPPGVWSRAAAPRPLIRVNLRHLGASLGVWIRSAAAGAALALPALLPVSLRASQTNLAFSALDFARQLNQAFEEVADKISPSVVVITVIHPEAAELADTPPEYPPRVPRQRSREPRGSGDDAPWRRRPVTVASGSGTVITADGYILTNNHVVEGAESIRVDLKDGRRFRARVRGLDPESDLAVIKIDAAGLTAARMGDSSKARTGEFVLAVGAPFELDYSVTVGHISAKGRSFETRGSGYQDQDFIQTDASINPGNSGGPLVNLDGEVVGINSMIRGLQTGIGFAIPSDLAKRVMAGLIKDGKFIRSWLGVSIASLRDDQDYKDLVNTVADGVIIRQIIPGGPASKSTLRPADIIVAVDGQPVRTSRQLKEAVSYKETGRMITLDVVRDGRRIQVPVKTEAVREPEKRPAPAFGKRESGARDFGLDVQELTKALAGEFKVEQTTGVIVIDIEQDSPADSGEIQPGDVITAVDRKPVRTLQEYKAAMKAANARKGVIIGLVGGDGSRRFTVLKEGGD